MSAKSLRQVDFLAPALAREAAEKDLVFARARRARWVECLILAVELTVAVLMILWIAFVAWLVF